MNDKQHILTMLRDEFDQWDALLGSMNEAQITAPQLESSWSIKDVVAHLWAWQQRSIARMEAAVHNREPQFPEWPAAFDPESEGQPHQLNEWLYATYRDKSWLDVYTDWKAGFLWLMELAAQIPENDLLEQGRYAWLEDYPLLLILTASVEHHAEHRGWLPGASD
jgi:hypothetical protein